MSLLITDDKCLIAFPPPSIITNWKEHKNIFLIHTSYHHLTASKRAFHIYFEINKIVAHPPFKIFNGLDFRVGRLHNLFINLLSDIIKVTYLAFLLIRYACKYYLTKQSSKLNILKEVRSSNCLHNYTSRLHHGLGETENTFTIPHPNAQAQHQHNTTNTCDLTLEWNQSERFPTKHYLSENDSVVRI